MSQLELERVAPSHAVAAALIRELDDELGTRYIGNTYSLCYEKSLPS